MRTAVKFLAWFDLEMRRVVGSNFSGDGNTTKINEDDNNFYTSTYLIHVREKITKQLSIYHAEEFWSAVEEGIITWEVYGDDITLVVPTRYVGWVNLESFKKYGKKYWHKELKADQTGEFSSLFSTIDATGRLLVGGPLILRRRLIVATEKINVGTPEERKIQYVMPYRDSKHYFARMGRSHTNLEDPEIEYFRLIMLMIDSHGTNYEAYVLLRRALQFLDLGPLKGKTPDPAKLPDEVKEHMVKLGVTFSFAKIPTMREIYDMFTPKAQAVREVMQHRNDPTHVKMHKADMPAMFDL